MITPTAINQNQELELYDIPYKIKNLKTLFEVIYTHKHNYKPIFGKIQPKYALILNNGISYLHYPSWEINTKTSHKIEFQYPITTYDQENKPHKDTIKIKRKQTLPSNIPMRLRKQIYTDLIEMEIGETKIYESVKYGVYSIELREISTQLSQLDKVHRQCLPLTIEERRELYWQPPIP